MSTPTIAKSVSSRASRHSRTLLANLTEEAKAFVSALGRISWPNDRYRNDPCLFAEEVLGIKLWKKQREILEAIRDHKRVTVRSGHKCGKSTTLVIAALWFYCTFPDARVVMSSTTARQVDAILWRELRKVLSKAKIPIDGDMHELARSGFKAIDFREIVGFTAREAEAVAGVSGAHLLYLLDEASGIPEAIFEAIEGNRAGGAWIVLASNPTRTEGEFFESFHAKSGLYRTVSISSEDSPNVIAGEAIIPGLATLEWVDEKRIEWGVESPLFKIRVKGDFVVKEDGKILSVHAITESEGRWSDTPGTGRLHLGVDPAGPGLAGDETAIAVRRGQRIDELLTWRGLSEDAIVVQIFGTLDKHRRASSLKPVVAIDREGPIGSALFYRLQSYLETNDNAFTLVGLKASDHAFRRGDLYDRVRDMLWANLANWVLNGGAVVTDTKLAKELHTPSWFQHLNGKLKVTPKDEIKKLIGRSPDRADAIALSVWDPTDLDDEAKTGSPLPANDTRATFEPEIVGRPALDPYAALSAFDGRRR